LIRDFVDQTKGLTLGMPKTPEEKSGSGHDLGVWGGSDPKGIVRPDP
jgi:hypothetical protein